MPVVAGGSKMNLVTGYAVRDDIDVEYGRNVWLAQTFPLTTETVLWRFRTKQWVFQTPRAFYHYGLRSTDAQGKPLGADFAHTTLSPIGEEIYSPGKWRRFDFNAYPTVQAGTYALILSVPESHQTWNYRARANGSTATYPGKVWKSTNSGETWEELAGVDLMFEVWGYHPPPPPPPEPVVSNWAGLRWKAENTAEGVKLTVVSDIPVHLYMRWTIHDPWKHPMLVKKRGAWVCILARRCFVDYHDNEQIEAGDTFSHTFIKEPWPVCQTRWFYFYGSKQTEDQPSESPIFKYHRKKTPVPPELELVIYEEWFEVLPPKPGVDLVIYERWSHEG